jgi:inner membrane protein involved in colicin E2 resistance
MRTFLRSLRCSERRLWIQRSHPAGCIFLVSYIPLRQQDYALLMGAIALFIVLAVVMYVTRKVDWYARDAS